jgi:hypothetical protein
LPTPMGLGTQAELLTVHIPGKLFPQRHVCQFGIYF